MMEYAVPYTVIIQDVSTGSVSSMLLHGPRDTLAVQLLANKACEPESHVVAIIRGMHPVLPGLPCTA